MTQLIAPLSYLLVLAQDTVHRPPMAHVVAFIQERGIDLTRRRIAESLTVEQITHLGFLLLPERPPGPRRRAGFGFGLLPTIVLASRYPEPEAGL